MEPVIFYLTGVVFLTKFHRRGATEIGETLPHYGSEAGIENIHLPVLQSAPTKNGKAKKILSFSTELQYMKFHHSGMEKKLANLQ